MAQHRQEERRFRAHLSGRSPRITTMRSSSITMVFSLFAFVLPFGCSNESEPPPRYVGKVGDNLLPVRLPHRLTDRSIIGKVASDEAEEPAGGQANGRESRVDIDDSSAQALARSFLDMLAEGNISQLPTIVVSDQQEDAQNLVDVLDPVFRARSRLRQLLGEVFPDVNVSQFVPADSWLGDWTGAWQLDTVDEITDDESTAVFVSDEQEELNLTLLFIDGAWRINHPDMPDADTLDQDADLMDRTAAAFEALATGIEDVELTDPEELESEFQRAMGGGDSSDEGA